MESGTLSGNVEAVYADTLVNDLAKLLLPQVNMISRSNFLDGSERSTKPRSCGMRSLKIRRPGVASTIADSVLPFTSLDRRTLIGA